MSQSGILNVSGSLPPDVPIDIGVDFDSSGNPPGNVTPDNNKFYIKGSTGIVTEAGTTDSPNDTVYVLFANGTTTTTDDSLQTILQFNTDTDDGFTMDVLFSAFEDATSSAYGGRVGIIAKNVGGTVSVISEFQRFAGGDAALAGCNVFSQGSGALLNILVQGKVGKTIRWTVITPGIVGGPIP